MPKVGVCVCVCGAGGGAHFQSACFSAGSVIFVLIVFVFVFLLVRPYLLITLTVCFKGHKLDAHYTYLAQVFSSLFGW